MLTHNTHYATFEERGTIVGYACYDIPNFKYLSPSGGWTSLRSKADIYSSRQVVKDIFPEYRYLAAPIFASDNNEMARRGYGIKGV